MILIALPLDLPSSPPRLHPMREKTSHWNPVMLPKDYFHRLVRDQEEVEKAAEKTRYVVDEFCGADGENPETRSPNKPSRADR